MPQDTNILDPKFGLFENQIPQLPRMIEMRDKLRAIISINYDWNPSMELEAIDCECSFGVIVWMEPLTPPERVIAGGPPFDLEVARDHPTIAYQERGEGWIWIKFHDDTSIKIFVAEKREVPQGAPY